MARLQFSQVTVISPINKTCCHDIYRKIAAMKVETDIVASIAANLIGGAVIMYVNTFKTNVIVFIGNIMCLTSH